MWLERSKVLAGRWASLQEPGLPALWLGGCSLLAAAGGEVARAALPAWQDVQVRD